MEFRVDPYLLMLPDNISWVRLREREGERAVDITLNQISLYYLLTIIRREDTGQPIIHKLMVNTLSVLGATIEKVIVDDLVNGASHSSIYVKSGEQVYTVDADIIDSIGLAVIQNCPIFITEDLFQKFKDEVKKIQKEKLPEISNEDAQMLLKSIDPNKLKS